MYTLQSSKKFKRKFKKIIKKIPSIENKVSVALDILQIAPFYHLLKTHKVTDINGKKSYSSSVTGDIRIIWNFDGRKAKIIDLLDLGGHSGGKKVYK